MNYRGTIAYRTGTLGSKVDDGFCASLVTAWDYLLRTYTGVPEVHNPNSVFVGKFNLMRGQSCMLHESANQIAENFLGDWFLMLDTDHVFQSDALYQMITTFEDNHLDVLVGFTQKRQPPYTPCIFDYDFDPEKSMTPIIPKGVESQFLVSIDASGCACLMVHRRVIEKISKDERPFQPRWKYENCWGGSTFTSYSSMYDKGDPFHWEDISFFWRVKLAGFQAWCAPWIKFYHLETRLVTERLIGRKDSND